MKRRATTVRTRLFCLFALLAHSIAFAAERPNIVHILIDDLGWQDVACYYRDGHQDEPFDFVDPLINSDNARIFQTKTASRPFGLVQLAPDTVVGKGFWGGYSYGTANIKGFGHVVSDDLVHWKDWPVAVWPDTQYDRAGVYSGNTFIHEGKIHGLYTGNVTGHGETYGMLTWTDDGGVTFKKKMVMHNNQRPNKHSPVHWDAQVWKEGDCWCQLIGGATEAPKQGAAWLWQEPIPELQCLRHDKRKIAGRNLPAGTSVHLPSLRGDALEIVASFERISAKRCGLIVGADGQGNGMQVWADAGDTPCTWRRQRI